MTFSLKKRAGVGVSSRENVARDDDDSFAPAAGTDAVAASKASERAARYARRSSFAAAAAAPETDKIDDETWASLPEVRDEIRGQPGTRATPGSARVLESPPDTRPHHRRVARRRRVRCLRRAPGRARRALVPGEAKRPAGRRGRRGRRRRPRRGARGKEGRRHRRRRRRLARPSRRSTPRSSRRSARRRARTLRAHYERAAGEDHARAASGRAHALEGWQERRRRRTKKRGVVFNQASRIAAANARRRRG